MGLIFVIIYLSHAVCQWSLYRPFIGSAKSEEEHLSSPVSNYTLHEESAFNTTRGLFTAFFWIILEPEHATNVMIIRDWGKGDFSLEFSHFVGQAVWAVYQIIVVILLLNVLIAIMNTRYAEVWERAEKEWKYSKTYYQSLLSVSVWTFLLLHKVDLPPEKSTSRRQRSWDWEEVLQTAQGVGQPGTAEGQPDDGGRQLLRLEDRPLRGDEEDWHRPTSRAQGHEDKELAKASKCKMSLEALINATPFV